MPKLNQTPLEILKYLDVGTCHITSSDNDQLTLDAMKSLPNNMSESEGIDGDRLIVYGYDCGFFVYVRSASSDTPLSTDYSHALANLLEIARDNRCTFLRIDRDGQKYEQFPEYSW